MRRESLNSDIVVDARRSGSIGTRNIVIVHSISLIRLGLACTITDSDIVSAHRVYAFANLAEASGKISEMTIGDVIVLDINAWLSANGPTSSVELEIAKERGVAFGLVVSMAQIGVSGITAYDLFRSTALEEEPDDVVSMVKCLAASEYDLADKSRENAKSVRHTLLSSLQLDILRLMANGLTNKQIALETGICVATVKGHVTKILKKLRCRCRAEAVVAFIRVRRRV